MKPPDNIRPPVCADDRWYPSDPALLRAWLDDALGQVPVQPLEGELIALIAPHAGYRFSGQTAAYAYRQLELHSRTRAIVIGPSHFADLGPYAITRFDYYATPLGRIPIDAAAVEAIEHKLTLRKVQAEREHSLEMQLPFLQHRLGDFSILPIMMSQPFYVFGLRARNACEELSAALAPLLDGRTILVASSDLSHLHDYNAVTYFDQGLQNVLEAFDLGSLVDYMINEGEPRACGDMAILTVLMAARARGANRVQVLYRTNSGDVTGMREPGQYTVGYMAAAIYRAAASPPSMNRR